MKYKNNIRARKSKQNWKKNLMKMRCCVTPCPQMDVLRLITKKHFLPFCVLLNWWVIPWYFTCHGRDNFEDSILDSSLVKHSFANSDLSVDKTICYFFFITLFQNYFFNVWDDFIIVFYNRLSQRGPEKSWKVKVEN